MVVADLCSNKYSGKSDSFPRQWARQLEATSWSVSTNGHFRFDKVGLDMCENEYKWGTTEPGKRASVGECRVMSVVISWVVWWQGETWYTSATNRCQTYRFGGNRPEWTEGQWGMTLGTSHVTGNGFVGWRSYQLCKHQGKWCYDTPIYNFEIWLFQILSKVHERTPNTYL